jgi:hypothetical protein
MPGESAQDPLKETALVTLKRVLDPLIELMLDTGITVQELGRLIRERAVRAAAARIARETGRRSNSRVAIVTGLARSEVARILKTDETMGGTSPEQHPARRVLAAWHDDRRFLDASGDPAVLPIFGRSKSFERIVSSYSGGIPVRAMLDQLSQMNALEILAGQRVRVRSRVPIFKGMNRNAIANIGERAEDLFGTLGHNLRAASGPPLFEATTLICDVDSDAMPFVRRQIAEQGTAFIDGTTSLLSRSRAKPALLRQGKRVPRRLGVTVYYFESEGAEGKLPSSPPAHASRKNLNRGRSGKRRYFKH